MKGFMKAKSQAISDCYTKEEAKTRKRYRVSNVAVKYDVYNSTLAKWQKMTSFYLNKATVNAKGQLIVSQRLS